MHGMFTGSGVTSLDLSDWDTSNVTCMFGMFSNANELTHLDVSGWDISNVRCMNRIFYASSLSQLALGENFAFNTGYCGSMLRRLVYYPCFHATTVAFLYPVPENEIYTGHWQNVGAGTPDAPQGTHVLTSDQLVETFDGATMADTWVWQRREWVTPPDFIPGDVNGDGQVTAADVAMLRAYLAGFPVIICMYAADVNGDGQVTAADVALIRAYLAGFPVILGQQ